MRASMLFVLSLAATATVGAAPLQVALTFDDLPWHGVLQDGDTPHAAIQRIAAVLRVHEAPATGFVNCARAEREPRAVGAWVAWGFTVGNHGTNHLDLNRNPLDAWLDDARNCDRWLARFGDAYGPWFRYPMLHEGATIETRDAAVAALAGLGLRNARVTVDTSDWLLANAYGNALRAGDAPLRHALAGEYVRHVVAAVAHADAVARRKLGRRVPQVLLLHANALAADHLDDVLLALRDDGVEFVDLGTALADPAYARADAYAGPRGLSWLYRMAPVSVGDADWDDAEAAHIEARFADAVPAADARVTQAALAAAAPAGLADAVAFAAGSERMHSLLVQHRGVLHAEAYFNGIGPEHPQNLKSITKTLVSMLTGIALREGWLASLDDETRALLTMSSLDEPPAFRYDTPVLDRLSARLVAASGRTLVDVANTELLAPSGAGPIDYWRTDDDDIELGGNDAYLLPRDLLRLGELMLRGGVHDGRRVLGEDFVAASTRVQIETGEPTINHGTLPVRGYGYLWWLLDDERGAPYAALGHGGQLLLVYPARELVIVMTSRWPGVSSVAHYRHLSALLFEHLLPLYPLVAPLTAPGDRSLQSRAHEERSDTLSVTPP